MAHAHGPQAMVAAQRGRLVLALGLVLAYMLAEIVGGWLTGSLALLADAGHMAADAGALALTLFALWVAQQPADSRRTFGYARSEMLAALVQGAALVAVAILIALQAWQRLGTQREVLGGPMLAVATGGLAVNLVVLWMLRGARRESLSVRGAWLHVMADALGSVGAMAAGSLIWAFGWHWADAVASLGIATLIVWSAWALLREAVDVLLEGAPGHIDVNHVRQSIHDLRGVASVHDLHVWTIHSGLVSLSSHVVAEPRQEPEPLLRRVEGLLSERWGIRHSTIQIEAADGPDCSPPC